MHRACCVETDQTLIVERCSSRGKQQNPEMLSMKQHKGVYGNN